MPAPKRPKLSPEEQHAQFVAAAKKLGTDDDPERFKTTVQRLAKASRAMKGKTSDVK